MTERAFWSTLPLGLALCAWLAGCSADAGPVFDDHTVPRLASREAFSTLAKEAGRMAVVKFAIAAFSDDERRELVFYDGAFYRLHDEWYWFRLLNGQPMPGDDEVEPVAELSLPTMQEIYGWAAVQRELPLDLAFYGERLYSPRFYAEALDVSPKRYGLGTLIRVLPPHGGGERWAFQLEYRDHVTHDELCLFFTSLAAQLPAEIAEALHWLVRSGEQEQLARTMEQQGWRFADRILRYSDISEPGAVEVYNPGLTAGRVLIVNEPADLVDTDDDTILVLGAIPDELPAAAGVITGVPQTPLAHINLLAQNRGIPNLHLGDALMHPELQRLDGSFGPAILRAELPDRMTLAPLTTSQYQRYRQLKTIDEARLPPVDLAGTPYTLALDAALAGDLSQMERLRPIIGGKAAGFLPLLAEPTVVTPDAPLVITVRAYVEHLAALRPRIERALAEPAFDRDARVRFLALEGRAAYDASYAAPADQATANALLAARPAGDALGDLVRAGGLTRAIRDQPIAPQTLALLSAAIEQRFAGLAPAQGLRFRSSSTVEDVEGFNGAGLYASHTGFRDAERRSDPDEQRATIARAIAQTWASYWGFAAFEERRRERIDHLSGTMAVLVHPRFDDEAELANGVFTMTVYPEGHAPRAVLTLNVQQGALSVTNPESTARPEVDEVTLRAGEDAPRVTRISPSTASPPGHLVLADEQLLALFSQARAVTEAWLQQRNRGVPLVQQARSLTLDFELRWMATGWPARAAGAPAPARLVLKQARPLEPGLRRGFAADVRSLPVPRDLLSRARRVQRRRCSADALELSLVEVLSDPAARPDLGHAAIPFAAWVHIEVKQALPELGWQAGEAIDVYHPHFAAVSYGEPQPGRDVEIAVDGAPAPAPARVRLGADGGFELARGAQVVAGVARACEVELLHSSPADYLLSLLEARAAADANDD